MHLQEVPPSRRALARLRRLGKYVLAALGYHLGLTGWLLRRCLVAQEGAIILGYHGVSEDCPALFSRGHSTTHLADLLRFLKRYLRPVRLNEIAAPVARGEVPPPGTFAVTFDDGLVNNVLLAVPLLRKLDLPATFFVPSGLVGSFRDLWVSSLRELIRAWPGAMLPAEPGLWPDLSVGDEASRFAAFFRIKQALKRNEPRRAELLARLAEQGGGSRRPPEGDRVVGPDLLRRLAEPGLSVGAHSRTHPILSRLDPEQAREEIAGSRADLQHLLDRPVLEFAYPNGRFSDFDEITCRLVAEAGYRCAVTTEPGIVHRGDDRLALRRCLPANVPIFLAGFELLVRAWRDRRRPGDLAEPVARRPSYLRRAGTRAAA